MPFQYFINKQLEKPVIVDFHGINFSFREVFVNRVFDGSIPSFITAFLQDKTLSEEEALTIKAMIDGVTKK